MNHDESELANVDFNAELKRVFTFVATLAAADIASAPRGITSVVLSQLLPDFVFIVLTTIELLYSRANS